MALLFTLIRLVVGIFFTCSGAIKLKGEIYPEIHQNMMSQFEQYAEVFPLKDLGFKLEPDQFLNIVGWIELVTGILLAFGPQILQEISNFVLCILLIVAIYSHLALKDPIAKCAPSTVVLGLLILLTIRGRGRKSKSKGE